MNVSAFTVRLIEHALAELAERVEYLPEDELRTQHVAIHNQPRSSTVDLVAAVYEREYWRRWPEGREDA